MSLSLEGPLGKREGGGAGQGAGQAGVEGRRAADLGTVPGKYVCMHTCDVYSVLCPGGHEQETQKVFKQGSFCFCFVLLRYNSHNMKFTLFGAPIAYPTIYFLWDLKRTIQWLLAYSRGCVTVTIIPF